MAAVFDMFRSRTAPPTGVHFKVSETEAQETVTRLQSYSRLKDQYAEIKRREFEWQARNKLMCEDCKRQAGEEKGVTQIEVTPEMIEEGLVELAGYDPVDSDGAVVVEQVFRAMFSACPIFEKVLSAHHQPVDPTIFQTKRRPNDVR